MKPRLPMIYILGNSHSGSTLLGFLLSAHPDIIFLGEFKSRTWLQDRICSCGETSTQCPFYKDILGELHALKKQTIEKLRRPGYRNIFMPAPSSDILEGLRNMYDLCVSHVVLMYPNAKMIVDSSKSLWLLDAWRQALGDENIRILLTKRPVNANVSSFVKRGAPFFKSLATILVNERLTRKYLCEHNLPFLEIDFDSIHENYREQFAAISAFTGLDIPVEYQNHGNHHVISGNRFTRKDMADQFGGIRKNDEWKTVLTGFQKRIISWLD